MRGMKNEFFERNGNGFHTFIGAHVASFVLYVIDILAAKVLLLSQ